MVPTWYIHMTDSRSVNFVCDFIFVIVNDIVFSLSFISRFCMYFRFYFRFVFVLSFFNIVFVSPVQTGRKLHAYSNPTNDRCNHGIQPQTNNNIFCLSIQPGTNISPRFNTVNVHHNNCIRILFSSEHCNLPVTKGQSWGEERLYSLFGEDLSMFDCFAQLSVVHSLTRDYWTYFTRNIWLF